MTLRLNKPYILFIVLIGTAALLFIGWAVTSQAYKEWSQGAPISGGFSWPIVASIDLSCFCAAMALYWKIYADSKVTLDSNGVSKPSLFGSRHIAWSTVTDIKIFGGAGLHIISGKQKIIISPHAYHDPDAVFEIVRRHSSATRTNGAA